MNFLKIIFFCNLFYSHLMVYAQEIPTEPTQITQVSETDPTTAAPITEQNNEQPVALVPTETVNNDAMNNWKNHLQALLVKDAHWDTVAQTPSTSWQNEAITLAEQLLKNDVSYADELKSSFLSTIKDKFTDVEKSSNISDAFSIIDNFKSIIDDLVKKIAPKEKTDIGIDNVSTEEKKLLEGQKQEPIISVPEEEITEETPEIKNNIQDEQSEEEKKKQKQLSQWQEVLNNIQTEGTDETEVKAIIDEAITVAGHILQSIPEEIERNNQSDILKDEFEQAVQKRSPELSPIKSFTITLFNNKIDALSQGKSIEETTSPSIAMPSESSMNIPEPINPLKPPAKTPSNTTKVKKPVIPQTAQEKKPTQIEPPTAPQAQTIITTTTVSSTQPPVVTNIIKPETVVKMKEHQERLVKIQLAAAQKVATEKEASKKGIISSIMGAVLGEWWTGPSAAEKTLQEVRQKQDSLLETMTAKFKPDDKALIKTAYYNFQEKLLTFDINKLWDTHSDKPKDELNKWIRKIESSLKILLKYNIMDVEAISNTLKETLKTNTKMPITCYTTITDTIIPTLKRYMVELEEEKALLQKQHEESLKKQQQESIEREQRTQQRLKQEEQEKQEAIKKQFEEKNKARADFNNLKNQWQQLMQQIEKSTPVSNEMNNEFAKKALTITKNMIEKLPLLPEENKQNIVDKHKADVSTALSNQQKNNPDINVFPYIDMFNKEIYTL